MKSLMCRGSKDFSLGEGGANRASLNNTSSKGDEVLRQGSFGNHRPGGVLPHCGEGSRAQWQEEHALLSHCLNRLCFVSPVAIGNQMRFLLNSSCARPWDHRCAPG
eukprot:4689198-Amphidinium_carterae.1